VRQLKKAAVLAALIGGTCFMAAPAQASSNVWYYTPFDNFGAAMYTQGGIEVSDASGDFRTVSYAQFRNTPFGTVHSTSSVTNNRTWEHHPDVYDFRVCNNLDGCSGWQTRI
jgi:hypothetical protein